MLPLNGRKFGNSFLQFSDATLEIGPGVVTPFFAGLRASIEPHILFGKILFGKILKNLELDRTKGNRHPDYGVKRADKGVPRRRIYGGTRTCMGDRLRHDRRYDDRGGRELIAEPDIMLCGNSH